MGDLELLFEKQPKFKARRIGAKCKAAVYRRILLVCRHFGRPRMYVALEEETRTPLKGVLILGKKDVLSAVANS